MIASWKWQSKQAEGGAAGRCEYRASELWMPRMLTCSPSSRRARVVCHLLAILRACCEVTRSRTAHAAPRFSRPETLLASRRPSRSHTHTSTQSRYGPQAHTNSKEGGRKRQMERGRHADACLLPLLCLLVCAVPRFTRCTRFVMGAGCSGDMKELFEEYRKADPKFQCLVLGSVLWRAQWTEAAAAHFCGHRRTDSHVCLCALAFRCSDLYQQWEKNSAKVTPSDLRVSLSAHR